MLKHPSCQPTSNVANGSMDHVTLKAYYLPSPLATKLHTSNRLQVETLAPEYTRLYYVMSCPFCAETDSLDVGMFVCWPSRAGNIHPL